MSAGLPAAGWAGCSRGSSARQRPRRRAAPPLLLWIVAPSDAGLSTLGVTLLPAFQRPDWLRFRAALFVCLGLWGVVPGLHAWAANGGEAAVWRALRLDLLMGAIYIVSSLLCGGRIRCAAARLRALAASAAAAAVHCEACTLGACRPCVPRARVHCSPLHLPHLCRGRAAAVFPARPAGRRRHLRQPLAGAALARQV